MRWQVLVPCLLQRWWMSRWVDRVISILHRKSPAGSHHPQRPPGRGLDRRSKTSILSPFSVQTIGERVGKQWQWGYGVAFLASLSPCLLALSLLSRALAPLAFLHLLG